MAYLADFTTQFSTTGATSYVLTLPDHEIDDILVVGANADAGVTLSMTGWTQVGVTQISASASSTGLWWKRAVSSAETGTVTMGTADAINVTMFVIRDVDTTTAVDVNSSLGTSTAGVFATASSFSSASVTTTTADCFVLYYLGIEPASTTPISALTGPGPAHFINSSDAGGSTTTTMTGSAAAWYVQRTTGATPTPTWYLSASSITHRFVVAFRHRSGGVIPPYIDDVVSLGNKLSTGSFFSTTAINGESHPAALTLANIGPNGTGQATTFDAAAVVVDAGFNPYSSALNSTPASTTTNAIGFQINFTAVDMTDGWIAGGFKASTSKMSNYNQGSIKQGGTYLAVGQGSNYRSYRIMARDNQDGNGTGFSVFSVRPNQLETNYGYSTTAPTITAIDKILLLHKGQNATGAFYYTDIHLFKQITVAGGSVTAPVDSQGVFDIGRYCRIPLIMKTGAYGLLAYVPLQIGGGDAVNFQIDAGALQFPRISNIFKREINYHGKIGDIGITYAGKSGDVIKHTNSVITSASPYYWTISASATSAATWDFSGLTVVNAIVTLRPVVTFSGMSFTKCQTITQTNSVIDGCNFSNSRLVVDNPANITNCEFTSSTNNPAHAVVLTAAGTYNFVGNLFTGYATTTSSYSGNFTSLTSGTTSAINYIKKHGSTWFVTGAAIIRYSTNTTTWTAATGTFAGVYGYVRWNNSTASPLYACAQIDSTNTYLTSTNGTAWTTRTLSLGAPNDFAWTGSTWIVVGNTGIIGTATDAITWTSRTSNTTNELQFVIWTGYQAVALGASGTIRTSTATGVTWLNKQSPNAYSFADVDHDGAGTIVAVTTTSDATAGIVFVSKNHGLNWVQVSVPLFPANSTARVSWSGTKFVVTGDGGYIAESSDGISDWTQKITGVSTNFTALGYGESSNELIFGTAGGVLSKITVPSITNEAVFNNSGGAITLNISGNGSTPSVRNSAGSTTTIVNAKLFRVTNIIDDSEVRILRASDSVELGGADTVGASPSGLTNVTVDSDPDNAGRYRVTYSYGYVSDTPINVVVFNVGYQSIFQATSLKAEDSSLLVSQVLDRQYSRGSVFTPA